MGIAYGTCSHEVTRDAQTVAVKWTTRECQNAVSYQVLCPACLAARRADGDVLDTVAEEEEWMGIGRQAQSCTRDRTVSISYDTDGDVLYITFGAPCEAYGTERDDGVVLRWDIATGRLAGMTILSYREHFLTLHPEMAGGIGKVVGDDELQPLIDEYRSATVRGLESIEGEK